MSSTRKTASSIFVSQTSCYVDDYKIYDCLKPHPTIKAIINFYNIVMPPERSLFFTENQSSHHVVITWSPRGYDVVITWLSLFRETRSVRQSLTAVSGNFRFSWPTNK